MAGCMRLGGARWIGGLLLLSWWAALPTQAGEKVSPRRLAIQGARILTVDGAVVEDGTLLIQGSRIAAVGADVEVPAGAEMVVRAGVTITPGLIDPYSGLGATGSDGGSASPTRRAEDAWDRYDTAHLTDVLRNGVTAVYVSPGGPSGICGTGAVVRLAPDGPEAIGRLLRREAALCIDLGAPDKPVPRLKTLMAIRKQFRDAVEYRRRLAEYGEALAEYTKKLQAGAAEGKEQKSEGAPKRPSSPAPRAAEKGDRKEGDAGGKGEKKGEGTKKPQRPARNRKLEVILRAIDGRMPVRVRAYRSADIFNALELAEEFRFSIIVEGATEAHLVAERIAEADVPVVLGRMDFHAGSRDDLFRRAVGDAGAVLDRAGVRWTAGSGAGAGGRSRFVALNAQLAARSSHRDRARNTHPATARNLSHGRAGGRLRTPFGSALKLVTADAADLLGVADRIGRLRPGLLADFVVWSGDPLAPATRVLEVYVGGVPVYQAAEGTAKERAQ